jgi:hypothetical protein
MIPQYTEYKRIMAHSQVIAYDAEKRKDYKTAELHWNEAAKFCENEEEAKRNVQLSRNAFFKRRRATFKVIQGGKA